MHGNAWEKPQRLHALDVFRGLTLAGMIIVNTPGSHDMAYGPLKHAEWNGLTAADLVFPFFVFIMGVAMVFSLTRRTADAAATRALYRHIIRRTAILFAIGLVLNLNPERALLHWRIMGVLQRLALVYCAGSLIVMRTDWRAQAAAAAGLLAAYWLMMKAVPVPGFGAGDLSREGNLAGYVDRAVMLHNLYKPGWDPEGLLSTLPSLASLLLGCLAGHMLRAPRPLEFRISALACAGAALAGAGLALGPWFPINKNLWSPPYALIAAGLAMISLAACVWVVDVKAWKRWTPPFLVLGMNSIVSYVLSLALLAPQVFFTVPDAGQRVHIRDYVYARALASWMDPHLASLVFALLYTGLIIALMTPLYKKRIFIKI